MQRIADAFPGHVHPAICVTKSGVVLVAHAYNVDMIALDNGRVVHAQPANRKVIKLVVSYDDGLAWTKRPWVIAEPGRMIGHACHLTQLGADHLGLVVWDSNRKQPVLKERVQGAAEAIVVEFIRWDVREDVGAGFFSPGSDVGRCRRLTQPSSQQ